MTTFVKVAGTAAALVSAGSDISASDSSTPCCAKKCEAPLVKMYSVDAEHGFCGESCMDPAKFDTYKKFEANLTIASPEHDVHPCSLLRTPDNSKRYTDYFSTVTHGVPGLLSVTLDLYAPQNMPNHACCIATLFPSQPCSIIPGKPTSLKIAGTGPYCCPKGATEEKPCGEEAESEGKVALYTPVVAPSKEAPETTPCCAKKCEAPLVKMFSVDAEHGFCGESCMDPAKFDTYKKFEANLTIASPEHDVHPCSLLRTPDNSKRYTDYFSTVTHGVPGLLSVTLDLYAPQDMPDHSCCVDTLFPNQPCGIIPGKPTSLKIAGTGPFCCPKGATEDKPCSKETQSSGEVALPTPLVAASKESTETTPCCAKKCEAPLVKMFSVDAEHGFCGESCMDPKKFSIYKVFEANLTIAKEHDLHPCHLLRTPDNRHRYTDYFSTVTHGGPGLSVTLDLYKPQNMPDHSCCIDTLLPNQPCEIIPGKGTSLKIFGTGPFCCPKGATEDNPCGSNVTVV